MKINKETRQLSKELLRASFTDGRLDSGRIASLVKSLIEKKPRNYIKVLESYKNGIKAGYAKAHQAGRKERKYAPAQNR